MSIVSRNLSHSFSYSMQFVLGVNQRKPRCHPCLTLFISVSSFRILKDCFIEIFESRSTFHHCQTEDKWRISMWSIVLIERSSLNSMKPKKTNQHFIFVTTSIHFISTLDGTFPASIKLSDERRRRYFMGCLPFNKISTQSTVFSWMTTSFYSWQRPQRLTNFSSFWRRFNMSFVQKNVSRIENSLRLNKPRVERPIISLISSIVDESFFLFSAEDLVELSRKEVKWIQLAKSKSNKFRILYKKRTSFYWKQRTEKKNISTINEKTENRRFWFSDFVINNS